MLKQRFGPSLFCAVAVAALAGSATSAWAQVTLWDSGPPKQVLFNGNATFLGYSSGNVSATLPQRWAAHPFQVPAASNWTITQVDANWFDVAGFESTDVNYIVFKWHPSGRDTAPNLPELVEQGILGAWAPGTDEPEIPGAENWYHTYFSCIELTAGNYYFTIYASGIGEGNTTGFSQLAWLTGADGGWEPAQVPGNIDPATMERNYMWRSAMFPIPGFVVYAPSNVQPLDGMQDIHDRWNCAYTFRGFAGAVQDCQPNGTPDVCEPDCNGNGLADTCDIAGPTSEDCNNNSTPDECEPGGDCDNDNTPDICEPGYVDCNTNENWDACDIAPGTATSNDCDNNGTPDECDGDCNTNGVGDGCDTVGGTSDDCNGNLLPDECEPDCNANGIADECDITGGTSTGDCNTDGIPNECQLGVAAYAHDDGTGENSLGLIGGGPMIWLNEFTVQPGQTLIRGVRVAYGVVANGSPATVAVWTDPNDDGVPNDAVLVASASTVVANANTNIFNVVQLPATFVGNAGEHFFVGVGIAATLDGEFPARFDQTDPDVNRSWISGSADPANIADAFNMNGAGFPGDLMVRADRDNDCNENFIADDCDIAGGFSNDANANDVPDECEDCNNNGTPDSEEPGYADCNNNGVADFCDIDAGAGDCNANGVPDECEDCNANGFADECDIDQGTSVDVCTNNVPDDCESDCNENGTPDECDIGTGASEDCQPNGFPDECDLLGVVVFDQTLIPTDLVNVVASDNSLNPVPPDGPIQVSADDFLFDVATEFNEVVYVGAPATAPGGDGTNDAFTVRFWADDGAGNPTTVEYTADVTAAAGEVERIDISGGAGEVYAYFVTLPDMVSLGAGWHWFEVFYTTDNGLVPDDWLLGFTDQGGGIRQAPIASIELPEAWDFFYPGLSTEHIIVGMIRTSADADANDIPDECEVACSLSGDMNGDGDVDGDDSNCFVSCVISGLPSGGCSSCDCANISVAAFVTALLN